MTGLAADAPGEVIAEVTALLRAVVGEAGPWAARIGPGTRLDGDLFLESVELAELGDALARRFGESVDLGGYIALLDIDEIIALTVADVAGYVAARHPASQGIDEGRVAAADRSAR